jgi:hypothetical protein
MCGSVKHLLVRGNRRAWVLPVWSPPRRSLHPVVRFNCNNIGFTPNSIATRDVTGSEILKRSPTASISGRKSGCGANVTTVRTQVQRNYFSIVPDRTTKGCAIRGTFGDSVLTGMSAFNKRPAYRHCGK